MKVTVDIPDRIAWALTDHAEKRGTNLPGMITGMVIKVFTPKTGAGPTLRDRVAAEWDKGTPDPVIAHRLGEPVEAIRVARRSLRLEPRKFKRGEWADELAQKDAA